MFSSIPLYLFSEKPPDDEEFVFTLHSPKKFPSKFKQKKFNRRKFSTFLENEKNGRSSITSKKLIKLIKTNFSFAGK